MLQTDPPIVVSTSFQASLNELWKALTIQSRMVLWFFEEIPAFKPEVGFQTMFEVQSNGRIFPHLWEVTEVDPLHKISYSWRYAGYAGDSTVSFELVPLANQTQLTLTHRVSESFPQDIPEFSRASCLGGWKYFLEERLKAYLEEETV